MSRVLVVGGGVVGTMHARAAIVRGHDVLQVDADLEARSASVRNFGLVWVSGRAAGSELALAVRARELWEEVGREAPGVGFRADGSLTVAQHPAEVAVLEQVAAGSDAAVRGLALLDAGEARVRNPALRGELLAALWCERDAIVEPGRALPSIRAALDATGRYGFLPGRTIVDVGATWALDHLGERHSADQIVVCPGASYATLAGDVLARAPLHRCRLQMMQTEPLDERLTTALADGDSLRYYPVFDVPAAVALPPASPTVAAHRAQLLVAQREGGELTIGDTHAYDEPFDFALDSEPYAHLEARVASLLGRTLPPVRRRWAGVYSQAADARVCYREEVRPGVVVVTGLGGRGMTLAPAVGEETMEVLDL